MDEEVKIKRAFLRRERRRNNPTRRPVRQKACAYGLCSKLHKRGFKRGMCPKHYRSANDFVKEYSAKHGVSKEKVWETVVDAAPLIRAQKPRGSRAGSDFASSFPESEFERQLIKDLQALGHGVWKLNANFIRGGGVPDLLIISEKGRVLFRELKTDEGHVEHHQSEFHRSMSADVGIWRPSDWKSGRIIKEIENATQEVTT